MTSSTTYDITQRAWTDPGGGVDRGRGDGSGGLADGGARQLLSQGSRHHRARPQPVHKHTRTNTSINMLDTNTHTHTLAVAAPPLT